MSLWKHYYTIVIARTMSLLWPRFRSHEHLKNRHRFLRRLPIKYETHFFHHLRLFNMTSGFSKNFPIFCPMHFHAFPPAPFNRQRWYAKKTRRDFTTMCERTLCNLHWQFWSTLLYIRLISCWQLVDILSTSNERDFVIDTVIVWTIEKYSISSL